MRRPKAPRPVRLTAHFESFEERLFMTADPAADFFLDDELAQEPYHQAQDVNSTLADVHQMTGVSYAHNTYGFDGAGQTVVVIDSGIAYDHYALGGGLGDTFRVVGGWDFTEENDADPYDDGPGGFHGTHVAGIIGSSDDVNMGVAPSVDLVALRVFNDQGAGQFDWVENALQWTHENRNAFENPITTVNLSLGTDWNSDTIPSWAPLEDEFAQLVDDGIFISVAAGNDFESYNLPGLSYPAASPHVVPVSSVTSTGDFSSFSQRHESVIAAPGHSITSTVPDYLFGFDGVTDDFATASGTSMAAPYVAGASVLLRDAMEFVGYSHITQDTIYDHLRSTADVFFDPATNQNYHRLNLENALDTLMPDDDYGSTAASAFSLGRVMDTTSFSGVIGTINDEDYFSFTAGHTGEVTLTAIVTGDMVSQWDIVGGVGTSTGDTLTFDVVAAQTYTVALATEAGIGHYDVDMELTPSMVDWGAIVQQQFNEVNLTGDSWFQFTATQSGTLTAEASFTHALGNVDLEVYDGNNQLLVSSNTTANNERVDVTAAAGDVFYLRARGTNTDVDFQLTNLVRVVGDEVFIDGTDANDRFSFSAGAVHSININGVRYSYSGNQISDIHFFGGSGSDTAHLWGTGTDENFQLHVGETHVSGGAYTAHAFSVENVLVVGNGGYDSVNFYDSAGDDGFVARPNDSYLRSDGVYNRAIGFDRVYALATNGGYDRVKLYDSPNDDGFVATPEYSYMRGDGFYHKVIGFDRVNAFASDGRDIAKLRGSAGNDTFYGLATYSYMVGEGFLNYTGGFDRVNAGAGAAGVDNAYLFDSEGNDYFYGGADFSYLRGTGFLNHAAQFDKVYAYSKSGGDDLAHLYGTEGTDKLTVDSGYHQLTGNGYFQRAIGFVTNRAYADAGHDTAVISEIGFSDTIYGRERYAHHTDHIVATWAWDFERVTAQAAPGQSPTADVSAVDFLFEQVGDWI